MMRYSLCLFILLAAGAQAQVTPMDTIVKKAAAQALQNPWVSLSVGVIKDGKTYQYNYGATGQTLYEIGSISKTFTTLLLARAVQDKKVKLTDDIRLYLKGDYPNLQFQGKPIQLIHLVNLTSSLPNNMPDFTSQVKAVSPDSAAYAIIKAREGYTREDFLRDLHQVKLDTFPGLTPRHSNAAAELLGFILENVYKDSYEHLVATYITGPLHLPHTFINIPDDQSTHLATCYNEKGTPLPHIGSTAGYAGSMKSSLEDMTRYLAYQLDEKSEAVRLTHQVAWGDIHQWALGMNWFLETNFDGQRRVADDGTTFGFTTVFQMYPERHFGVVILLNECGNSTQQLLYTMANLIYDKNFFTPAEMASDGFGFSVSINLLLAELQKRGFAQAIPIAGELSKSHPGYTLSDGELNAWAYSLLRKGKHEEALEIFKLNTSLHPQSWNDYDSEAEGYEAVGDKANAIKFFNKSLELNPGNTNATEHLKKLQP